MIKIQVQFPTAIDFSSLIFPNESPETHYTNQAIREPASFSYTKGLIIFYIIALLIFTFRMIRNLFKINLVAIENERINYKGYEITLTDNPILPYSFLKRIFLNREDFTSGKISDDLLQHEIHHIEQRHSIDIILMEIIQTLFWFNPILILLKRAMKLNHEYLADYSVIKGQTEYSAYQQVLIDAVSDKNVVPITCGFGARWTKKRLLMMTKDKSVLSSTFKILLSLPIIFFIAVSFIFSEESTAIKSVREAAAIYSSYENFFGSWEGSGKFFNCSLHDEVGTIPFNITINKDRTINGMVGNATLQNAYIQKARYGLDIIAELDQPIRDNYKIDKEYIIILWVLPEMKKNKVDADFHLQNNLVFDAFLNVGGVVLTKAD
jgi:hypothetical protein